MKTNTILLLAAVGAALYWFTRPKPVSDVAQTPAPAVTTLPGTPALVLVA